jgi:adenylate cyclase
MQNKTERTIMFADVVDSTGMFSSLGNEVAAKAIADLTRWMSEFVQTQGGQLVKHLGDGVLFSFTNPATAINAAVQLQRTHVSNQRKQDHVMQIQIGLAEGEVVELGGDTFGGAVNLASRLSNLAGADQIWCLDTLASKVPRHVDYKLLPIGRVKVRGRAEGAVVIGVEWKQDVSSSLLTLPVGAQFISKDPTVPPKIVLTWNGQTMSFEGNQYPIFELGRQVLEGFVISDPRASRVHAKLMCDNGVWSIQDMSSYGTWVWFDPDGPELSLRRTSCVLHDQGTLYLAAPRHDPNSVAVRFTIIAGARQPVTFS